MLKTWEKYIRQLARCNARNIRDWVAAVREEVLGPRHPNWRSW